MRIAIINQPFDTVLTDDEQHGSVAIVNWELARCLSARHEVTIWAPGARGQAREDLYGAIRIRRLPFVLKRFHKLIDLAQGLAGDGDPYLAHSLYFRDYAVQLARALARQRFDVVHVATCFQYGPVLRRALPHTHLVLHVHNHELALFDRATTAQPLQAFDAIVTVSDFVSETLRRRFPEYRGTITTIWNGVDTGRFLPAECNVADTKRRLLFVSRVSPDKGVHVLVRAFESILKSGADVRLDIVGKPGFISRKVMQLHCRDPALAGVMDFYGGGALNALRTEIFGRCESYIQAMRRRTAPVVDARIRWRGLVPLQELVELYANASVFVLPSLWHEGFGIPVVEAMASAVPVVASRSGAVPELVVDRITGRLVERGDVDGLAGAIIELLDDEEQRRRVGAAGRARVESMFTWAHSAKRFEQVLARLADQRQ